jgi:sigma-E factor negative regulatory protein RseC
MESPSGTIVAIDAASVTIAVQAGQQCARCASGRGCGAGLLGSGRKTLLVQVALPPGNALRQGDRVSLALQGTQLLRATLLVYGLPLAGVLLVMTLGSLLVADMGDWLAAGLAAGGLAAGAAAGRRLLGNSQCLRQFVPTIEGQPHGAG